MDLRDIAKLLVEHAPNELKALDLPVQVKSLTSALKKSELGKGSYGVVFDLYDGRVLKITVDGDDAFSSKVVLGAGGVKGVVKVHDVFQVMYVEEKHRADGSPYEIHKKIYGIIQDKIIAYKQLEDTMGSKASKRLEAMINTVFDAVWKQWPKIDDVVILKAVHRSAVRRKFAPIEIDTCIRWATALMETLVELRHIKVFIHDLHVFNAGFEFVNGDLNLVLFDLGNRSYRGDSMELRLAANV